MEKYEKWRLQVYEKAVSMLKNASANMDYIEAKDMVRQLGCGDNKQFDAILSLMVPVDSNIFWTDWGRKKPDTKDVLQDAFDGKTSEDYEKMRLSVVKELSEDNLMESIWKIEEKGTEIAEAVERIVENRNFRQRVKNLQNIDIISRMAADGLPLTKVVRYLGTDLLDTYHLAEMLGHPFSLSDEEKQMVEEAEKQQKAKC